MGFVNHCYHLVVNENRGTDNGSPYPISVYNGRHTAVIMLCPTTKQC